MALDQAAMIAILKQRQGGDSLRVYAKSLGVSVAYLSDIYLGRRTVGNKICDALGYVRQKTTVTTMKFTKSKA
jgi:hypothetical protein